MKKNVLIIILQILIFEQFFAQVNYLSNYSPASNIVICKDKFKDVENTPFDVNQGFVCSNGVSVLYYSIHSITSENITGSQNNFSYSVTYDGGTSSSYKIYGPFEYGDDYELAIATNTAQVINSGGMNAGERFLSGDFIANKFYILEIKVPNCVGIIDINPYPNNGTFDCQSLPQRNCENCLPKFQPINGKYIISAWVKEENNSSAIDYSNSSVKVYSGTNIASFQASGQIIDGWQRIEGIFQTDDIGSIKIELITTSQAAYFDDIRIFPFNASMISYVYDPITLRLVAELDERNYAKLYEYDEEGKLIRVKKETEKGIMTIQENRENVKGN